MVWKRYNGTQYYWLSISLCIFTTRSILPRTCSTIVFSKQFRIIISRSRVRRDEWEGGWKTLRLKRANNASRITRTFSYKSSPGQINRCVPSVLSIIFSKWALIKIRHLLERKYQKMMDCSLSSNFIKRKVIVGDKILLLLVQLVVLVSTLLLLRILRVIPNGNGEGRRERKFKNSLQRLDYRDSGVWIESGSAPYTENI